MKYPRPSALGLALAAGVLFLAALPGAARPAAQPATPGTAPPAYRVASERELGLPAARVRAFSPSGEWLAVTRASTEERELLCAHRAATLSEHRCVDLRASGVRGVDWEHAAWSPDGDRLAFTEDAARAYHESDLWVFEAPTGRLTALTPDGEDEIPFFDGEERTAPVAVDLLPAWSPNGREIAFARSLVGGEETDATALYRIPAAGGEPTLVTEVAPQFLTVYFGLRWTPFGDRLLYTVALREPEAPANGLWSVGPDGSDPRQLAGPVPAADLPPADGATPAAGRDGADAAVVYPRLLDVSSRGDVALVDRGLEAVGAGSPPLALLDLDTGDLSPVVALDPDALGAPSLAGFSPNGAALLTLTPREDGFALAVRAVGGETETPLLDGLGLGTGIGSGRLLSWAEDGVVYLPTRSPSLAEIVPSEGDEGDEGDRSAATPGATPTGALALDRLRVAEERAVSLPGARVLALSPDGRRLAVARDREDRLCVLDVATLADETCADLRSGDVPIRLNLDRLVWSPDSTRLAFDENPAVSLIDGDLWVMDAATGALTNLTDDGFEGGIPLSGEEQDPGQEIWLDVLPAWSPDGTELAFARTATRRGELGGTALLRVPAAGGEPEPVLDVTTDEPLVVYFGMEWLPDGSGLLYTRAHTDMEDPSNGVWRVDLAGGRARQVAGQVRVGDAPDAPAGFAILSAVSPGGDRALVVSSAVGSVALRDSPWALVDLAGGEVAPVRVRPNPNVDTVQLAYPAALAFSPDGGALLYATRLASTGGGVGERVVVRDLATGAETTLLDGLEIVAPPSRFGPLTWGTDGTVYLPGPNPSTGLLVRLEEGAP